MNDTNDKTPFAKLLGDAAADIVAEHDDGASHYIQDRGAWRPISRFAYGLLVKVSKDVRLLRVER